MYTLKSRVTSRVSVSEVWSHDAERKECLLLRKLSAGDKTALGAPEGVAPLGPLECVIDLSAGPGLSAEQLRRADDYVAWGRLGRGSSPTSVSIGVVSIACCAEVENAIARVGVDEPFQLVSALCDQPGPRTRS